MRLISKSPNIYNQLSNGFYQTMITMILCSISDQGGKLGKLSHFLKSKIMFLAIGFDLDEESRVDFWNTTQTTSLYNSFRFLFICEYFKAFFTSFKPTTTRILQSVLDGFDTKLLIDNWFMPAKSKRHKTKLPKYISNFSILKDFSTIDCEYVFN